MFGEIKMVQVCDEEEYALVTFKDFISAFFAQQSLNNYFLAKYNATLAVKWLPKETQQTQNVDVQMKPEINDQPDRDTTNFKNQNVFQQYENYNNTQTTYLNQPQQSQQETEDNAVKYTCRFDI